MTTAQRREEILALLNQADAPIAAKDLAARFGVSRVSRLLAFTLALACFFHFLRKRRRLIIQVIQLEQHPAL